MVDNIFVPLSTVLEILETHFKFDFDDLKEFKNALSISGAFVLEKKPLAVWPEGEKKQIITEEKSYPAPVPKSPEKVPNGSGPDIRVPDVEMEEKSYPPPAPKYPGGEVRGAEVGGKVSSPKNPEPPKYSNKIVSKNLVLKDPNIQLSHILTTLKMFDFNEKQLEKFQDLIPLKYLNN